MFNIGPQELLIVLILALIVVGPHKLPELSRQIGKGLREFRKVQDEVKGMVKLDLNDPTDKPAPRRPAASPTSPGVHRTRRPAPAATPSATASTPMDVATPPATETAPADATPGAGGDSPAVP